MQKDLQNIAKNIKLILMDVDGVLTRGEIFFDANGNELKIWNVKDGLSFSILKRLKAIETGWITGRKSENVEKRAKSLGVKYLSLGSLDKKTAFLEILENSKLSREEVAYIGDDLVDISVLKEVGLSICPSDAVPEVKDLCDLIADCGGGGGVFRFALKFILQAQDKWDGIERVFEAK